MQALIDGRKVVGVDISARQLALARSLVPGAQLVRGDMRRLPFRPATFDAAVALFSFVHVPRASQLPTLRLIASCLRPGGVLAANFGTGGSSDSTDPDWLGVPMFFAGFDPPTNERMVLAADLRIETSEVRAVEEDGELVDFHWVIARLG
jgi:SAM-dependent methyltransferase